MGSVWHAEKRMLGDKEGLSVTDMTYERGHKVNCFSSSNSVLDFLVLVVDKCIKCILS